MSMKNAQIAHKYVKIFMDKSFENVLERNRHDYT